VREKCPAPVLNRCPDDWMVPGVDVPVPVRGALVYATRYLAETKIRVSTGFIL